MARVLVLLLLLGSAGARKIADVFSFTATGIDGVPQKLSQFRGKPALIVNVASEWYASPRICCAHTACCSDARL